MGFNGALLGRLASWLWGMHVASAVAAQAALRGLERRACWAGSLRRVGVVVRISLSIAASAHGRFWHLAAKRKAWDLGRVPGHSGIAWNIGASRPQRE